MTVEELAFLSRVQDRFPNMVKGLTMSHNINGMFLVPPRVWEALKSAGLIPEQKAGEPELFHIEQGVSK